MCGLSVNYIMIDAIIYDNIIDDIIYTLHFFIISFTEKLTINSFAYS